MLLPLQIPFSTNAQNVIMSPRQGAPPPPSVLQQLSSTAQSPQTTLTSSSLPQQSVPVVSVTQQQHHQQQPTRPAQLPSPPPYPYPSPPRQILLPSGQVCVDVNSHQLGIRRYKPFGHSQGRINREIKARSASRTKWDQENWISKEFYNAGMWVLWTTD